MAILIGIIITLCVKYAPVCPRISSSIEVIRFVPEGELCNERIRCQNNLMNGDMKRQCWLFPGYNNLRCQAAGQVQEGGDCWLRPNSDDIPQPVDSQCSDGKYCWTETTVIHISINETKLEESPYGICLPKRPDGAACKYHISCMSNWCKVIDTQLAICAPVLPRSSPCKPSEICEDGHICSGEFCVKVNQQKEELCDQFHKCASQFSCLGSRCRYLKELDTCTTNQIFGTAGGCDPSYLFCNVTNPRRSQCKKIPSTCTNDRVCGVGRRCNFGHCEYLKSIGEGMQVENGYGPDLCKEGSYESTTSVPHTCEVVKKCITDAECVTTDDSNQLTYCQCSGDDSVGICSYATNVLDCPITDGKVRDNYCCSLAKSDSSCSSSFRYRTSVFAAEFNYSLEHSPLWCNQRCVRQSANCFAWAYDSYSKKCSLRSKPFYFIASSHTENITSSELLFNCTTSLAFDASASEMEIICPVVRDSKIIPQLDSSQQSLIVVPTVPAYSGLGYFLTLIQNGSILNELLRELNVKNFVWSSVDINLVEGDDRISYLKNTNSIWLPPSLSPGKVYTITLQNESIPDHTKYISAIHIKVMPNPVYPDIWKTIQKIVI